jgi:hypothetical protein
MRTRIAYSLLALAVGFAAWTGATRARAGETPAGAAPTAIELFTSQGCSSCPPADELLYEMAGREEVVAISWHVSYWDYIGWKDPFATAWSTDRQMGYRGKLGRNYAYTPQMVIDGRHDVVGSRRGLVGRTVDQSRRDAAGRIPVTLARDPVSGELVIAFAAHALERNLDIWLVGYSGVHETKVLRGENRGGTLRNTHIARTLQNLGTWDGAAGSIRIAPAAHDDVAGFALLLQEPGQGAILGAAKLDLNS